MIYLYFIVGMIVATISIILLKPDFEDGDELWIIYAFISFVTILVWPAIAVAGTPVGIAHYFTKKKS